MAKRDEQARREALAEIHEAIRETGARVVPVELPPIERVLPHRRVMAPRAAVRPKAVA